MKNLQECLSIVNSSKSFVKKNKNIDGYDIVSFDYKDGTKYQEFLTFDAFELRGLTFIENKPFPMLHKFFNLGEIHPDDIHSFQSKTIKSIQIKDDGSLIGFILLPNNKVIPKTKTGFSNPYTDIASKWLSSNNNEDKIRQLLQNDIHPLFECVSPHHKIVLPYDFEGLKFIQARTSSGKYFSVETLSQIAQDLDFIFEKPLNYTLSELLSLQKSLSDVEGFIVRFSDDTFVKIKTNWYFDKHFSSDAISRLNTLLTSFFNGQNISEYPFESEFLNKANSLVFEPYSLSSIHDIKYFLSQ
jgi:T4 RnlA family RNA ligase